jgi:hypothetical protein
MRDIDDFLPEVLTYAPNCNEPQALKAIREAARELCHNARLWRDNDTIQLSSPLYSGLCTIADASIVDIEAAQVTESDDSALRSLEPVTMAWLNDNKPQWASDPDSNTANYVFTINPNTVSTYPRQTGTLKLKLVLQPSLTALTLPDWLYDLHRTVIGGGAAAKLLVMPSDWANPTLGTGMLRLFNSKVASIKTEATKGQQGARLRTKGDWF